MRFGDTSPPSSRGTEAQSGPRLEKAHRGRAVCDDVRDGRRDAARCPDAVRGEPDRPGQVVPGGSSRYSAVDPCPRKLRAAAGSSWRVAYPSRQPARRQGDGQSDLAAPFRARTGQRRPTTSVCGLPPSHPELLDYLATQFIAERLVDQGDASAARSQLDLSAVIRLPASVRLTRPRRSQEGDLYSPFARRRLRMPRSCGTRYSPRAGSSTAPSRAGIRFRRPSAGRIPSTARISVFTTTTGAACIS